MSRGGSRLPRPGCPSWPAACQRPQAPDVSLERLGLSCLLPLVKDAAHTLAPHQPVDKVDQVQVGQLAVEALDLEVDMSREF